MRRLIGSILLSTSCATMAGIQADSRLAQGIWGGEHVQMTVSASGAVFEFDCATGAITEPLKTGPDDRMDLNGSYLAERPGAVQTEGQPAKVRYVGRLQPAAAGAPAQFTFSISLDDSAGTIGPFTVAHGAQGRVRKCR